MKDMITIWQKIGMIENVYNFHVLLAICVSFVTESFIKHPFYDNPYDSYEWSLVDWVCMRNIWTFYHANFPLATYTSMHDSIVILNNT